MVYAGGMYSTAADLANFISAHFDDNKSCLSDKSKRMMQQLGIGWLRNYPFVMHEGSMLGRRSVIVLHPEYKTGWVILTNASDFQFNKMNEYIWEIVAPLISPQPVTEPEQYVGTYALDGGFDRLLIYLVDGKLYSTYLEDILPHKPLNLSGDNSYTAGGMNGRQIHYQFIVRPGSTIRALSLNQLLWIKQ